MPLLGNLFVLNKIIENNPELADSIMPPPPCPEGATNPWDYWTPRYNFDWLKEQITKSKKIILVGSPSYFISQVKRAASPHNSIKASLQMEILLLIYSGYQVVLTRDDFFSDGVTRAFVLEKVKAVAGLEKVDPDFENDIDLLSSTSNAYLFWKRDRVHTVVDFILPLRKRAASGSFFNSVEPAVDVATASASSDESLSYEESESSAKRIKCDS